ncbi:hypothetical protein [Naasia aerilata]|uniref:DUF4233 domain-containing protein n=1 Tax=Naasia aerilata TaxID=1162966 RepID=A0ABN6XRQ4_9MICO|nr:hypothetical protein [Naasia aerilata]BDZ47644.1 hypothetical protein GCM10025866_35530 [Naasia aerilata]
MAAHAVLAVLAIWAGLLGILGWLGVLVIPVAAASSLLWRKDVGPAMAVLICAGVVFGPVALVALFGQYLLAALELAGWLLGGRKGPMPKAGPLGRTRRSKVRARRRTRAAVERHESAEH